MQTIQLETSGPVAWVWLNRPRQLNALDQTMLAELHETFGALDKDESVRAVVLAGRGPAFSAGFDIAWMTGQDAEAMTSGLAGIEAVYDTVEACSRPVVAALHGAVLGGGLLLALVADLRLAAERASLGVPEVKIGIFPNLHLIPRLERMVGLGAAKRLVLCGEPVDAAEARRIGLVEQVVPAQALYAEAQALAERLAALPAYAVQAAKQAFAAARRPDFVAWERARFAACWTRPEREAGMRAFLKGRPAERERM
jgi:enoyl-CoA hydratase/carnithine racemase